ncbi:protein spinster homolog 3 [Brienomyrus brachyistius]|uniref:protein spinster homolog 3 n=1 Tax=Brienomyrus brachyistius TaxID=42636 RepID=UPI0020B325B7|nr:protein spinster homolog 3 [Brienomyrus brachyistius]
MEMDLTGPSGASKRLSLRDGGGATVPYGSLENEVPPPPVAGVSTPKRSYIMVVVLCYVNLLNYMDRYTIAGILDSIQKYFNINDSSAGLLQTVFICSFLVLAPVFGYLGDRYDRKLIISVGQALWILTSLGSSFITEKYFWVLLLTRAFVGIGEASYCTIAPTIIGDLFIGAERTLMISLFYIFIPVGCGLGYIIGHSIATATGDWHWALRLNPILGLLGLILILVFLSNPARGAAEAPTTKMTHTSYGEDVKYLLKNRSFVLSSLGVTAMTFVTGALAFWTPIFLQRAREAMHGGQPCAEPSCVSSDSYVFGAITVVTGILGVLIGSIASRKLKGRVPHVDPLICAVGLLSSSPCFFLAIVLAYISIPAAYVFIAIGETLLSLSWPILADILLYVVVPTRRATAEALQITVCHLFGDAGSPYLLGLLSDWIKMYQPDSFTWRFRSLEYSFMLCPFVGVLGGLFFLLTSLHVTKDRKAAELLVTGRTPPPPNLQPGAPS